MHILYRTSQLRKTDLHYSSFIGRVTPRDSSQGMLESQSDVGRSYWNDWILKNVTKLWRKMKGIDITQPQWQFKRILNLHRVLSSSLPVQILLAFFMMLIMPYGRHWYSPTPYPSQFHPHKQNQGLVQELPCAHSNYPPTFSCSKGVAMWHSSDQWDAS